MGQIINVTNEEYYHIYRINRHNDLWEIGRTIKSPVESFNYYYDSLIEGYNLPVSFRQQQYHLIDYLESNIEELFQFNNTLDEDGIDESNISNIKGFNSHVINLLNQTFESYTQLKATR